MQAKSKDRLQALKKKIVTLTEGRWLTGSKGVSHVAI